MASIVFVSTVACIYSSSLLSCCCCCSRRLLRLPGVADEVFGLPCVDVIVVAIVLVVEVIVEPPAKDEAVELCEFVDSFLLSFFLSFFLSLFLSLFLSSFPPFLSPTPPRNSHFLIVVIGLRALLGRLPIGEGSIPLLRSREAISWRSRRLSFRSRLVVFGPGQSTGVPEHGGFQFCGSTIPDTSTLAFSERRNAIGATYSLALTARQKIRIGRLSSSPSLLQYTSTHQPRCY